MSEWYKVGETLGVTPVVVALIVTINGGGSVITTGQKGYVSMPFACTITGWDIIADISGDISIDVDKHAGTAPNNTTDKISASSPIALPTVQIVQNGSISGWTTSITKWDVLGFYVTSASIVQQVTFTLYLTKV